MPAKYTTKQQQARFLTRPATMHKITLYTPAVGCSENIKNHIFYYADTNYGALTYTEYEYEENNSNFEFLPGCFAI